MMRRLYLPLLLLFVVLPSCSKEETSAKETKAQPEAFTCGELQNRAETCAPQTLARVKTDLADRSDHEQQYKMFEIRFKKRLAAKKTKAQCEKFQATKGRAARVDAMRACYAKEGCEAFSACMLQL